MRRAQSKTGAAWVSNYDGAKQVTDRFEWVASCELCVVFFEVPYEVKPFSHDKLHRLHYVRCC